MSSGVFGGRRLGDASSQNFLSEARKFYLCFLGQCAGTRQNAYECFDDSSLTLGGGVGISHCIIRYELGRLWRIKAVVIGISASPFYTRRDAHDLHLVTT